MLRATISNVLTVLLLLLPPALAPASADGPAKDATEMEVEAPGSDADAAPTPKAIVDELHDALLEVMKESDTLGFQKRYERLEPVVRKRFDLPFMAEKCAGRYWKDATSEEQQRLVDMFSRYTISNYAGRFVGWSGQHFEVQRDEPSARGTVLVHSRLVSPDDDDIELDYRLRNTGSAWRIIDIYFNGTVSELALRRSEYASMIKRGGFEALLTALDERIEELRTAPADQG